MAKPTEYTYSVVHCEDAERPIEHPEMHVQSHLDEYAALGWRYHSLIPSDAFGIKNNCVLMIFEREVKKP